MRNSYELDDGLTFDLSTEAGRDIWLGTRGFDLWLTAEEAVELGDRLEKIARASLQDHRSRERFELEIDGMRFKGAGGGDLESAQFGPDLPTPINVTYVVQGEPLLELAQELQHLGSGIAQARGREEVA